MRRLPAPAAENRVKIEPSAASIGPGIENYTKAALELTVTVSTIIGVRAILDTAAFDNIIQWACGKSKGQVNTPDIRNYVALGTVGGAAIGTALLPGIGTLAGAAAGFAASYLGTQGGIATANFVGQGIHSAFNIFLSQSLQDADTANRGYKDALWAEINRLQAEIDGLTAKTRAEARMIVSEMEQGTISGYSLHQLQAYLATDYAPISQQVGIDAAIVDADYEKIAVLQKAIDDFTLVQQEAVNRLKWGMAIAIGSMCAGAMIFAGDTIIDIATSFLGKIFFPLPV